MMFFFLVVVIALFGTCSSLKLEMKSTRYDTSSTTDLIQRIPGRNVITGEIFDPLQLHTKVSPERLKLWREVELKHGRVAMLAAVGMIAAEIRPFSPLFEGKVAGPSIYHVQQIYNIAPRFWVYAVLAVGAFEMYSIALAWGKRDVNGIAFLKNDYVPGDLAFDPLNFANGGARSFGEYSPEFYTRRDRELNNGRLAMIAVAGMWLQELVDKRTIMEHIYEYGFKPATNPTF